MTANSCGDNNVGSPQQCPKGARHSPERRTRVKARAGGDGLCRDGVGAVVVWRRAAAGGRYRSSGERGEFSQICLGHEAELELCVEGGVGAGGG